MSTKTARATKTEANVVCPSHLEGSTLPLDWEWVSLGNICRTTSGGTPSRKNKEYFEGDIPWVKSGELPDGPVSEIEEYITGEAVKNSSAKQFPKGTLLIALYGATVGKLGVLTKEAATNQAVCAIFPPDYLETKYLFWYLRFVRPDLIAQAIGGAQPNISQGILRNLLIPVAPLCQQMRIVAEIEKQFSRLDEAIANLKRVKANLKRYKAAVLKAAVEGKLTEDWRMQHPDVEPASKLLERILAERRAKWNGRGKYKEPPALDTPNLPELPDLWGWATMPQLGELNRGKSKHRPRNDLKLFGGPYPFIQTGDVKRSGGFVRSHSQTYNELGLAQSRLWPAGTLCITIAANIAETGILTYSACFPDSVVGFVFCSAPVTVRFIDLFFRTEREEIARFAPATAQKNINLEILSAVAIPIPPLEEQKEIVAEVERRLSVIEELEAAVEANLTRADRLRQAILEKAFNGKLLSNGARG